MGRERLLLLPTIFFALTGEHLERHPLERCHERNADAGKED